MLVSLKEIVKLSITVLFPLGWFIIVSTLFIHKEVPIVGPIDFKYLKAFL